MRQKLTLLALLFAVFSLQATAQDRTISGKVTSSEDKSTVPGVSVVVVGTTIGTSTDMDGNYKLTVPSSAKTLRFSGVGMKSKDVALGASNNMDVELNADVMQLEEMVVSAIGIKQEKKAVGYSTQTVSGDNMTKAGQTNALSALAGKVAGAQVITTSGTPGASVSFRLRGVTSITGDNSPLIIIDGVPIDNSYDASGNPDNGGNNLLESVNNSNRAIDLNPDDIESINVLKGPSATALYGINAANGALIITTKKGKSKSGGGVTVTLGTKVNWSKVNKLPELQNQWVKGTGYYLDGSYDAENPRYQSYESTGSGSWGPSIDTTYWDPSQTTLFNANGQMIGATVAASTPGAIKMTPFDNVDQFFRTGFAMENNVSLSGGNDNNTFRISYSRVKDDGIVPLSDFSRNTLSLAGSSALSKKLSASGSFTYSNSGGRRVQQGSNLSGLMLDLLRTPVSFDNSNGNDDPEASSAYLLPVTGGQRNYRGGVGYDNPYWTINQNPFKDEVNRLIGVVQANYQAYDWLDFTYRVGTDFYTDRRNQQFAIGSGANPDGQVFNQDIFYRHLNSDLIANARHKFNDDLNGSLTLGINSFNYVKDYNYVQGDILNFPDFFNISNASSVLSRQSTFKYRTRAMYGQGRLAWRDQLFLEVTGRSESSSTLPEENNTFFYPSIAMGWVFSETYGLQNDYFSYGKLRASYAIVGKDAPLYALQNYYGSATAGDGWTSGINFPFNGQNGYTVDDVLGNPDLKPERTKSLEVGADLKFLENRLGVDVTYYKSTSEDQILAVPIAGSSGYSAQIKNAGSMENKGWEIMLYATPVKLKDFQWDIALNFSRNRNKVISLADGVNELFLGGFEGSAIYAVTGQPYGQIYGGRFLRDDNGNLVLVDGYPVQDPQVGVIGNPNPDWLMGITNSFSYKNFTLTTLFDIRQGGDIWNGTRGALVFFGRAAETENRNTTTTFNGVVGNDVAGNVIITSDPSNVEVVLDQAYYQGVGSGFSGPAEPFVEDGSFVRLRELSLSYTLDKKWLKGTPFGSIDISFIGRNLWLSTKYKGVDPETSLTGASNSLGMDYFNMPGTKSYGLSLRVTL